jgi:hypothetical protein
MGASGPMPGMGVSGSRMTLTGVKAVGFLSIKYAGFYRSFFRTLIWASQVLYVILCEFEPSDVNNYVLGE